MFLRFAPRSQASYYPGKRNDRKGKKRKEKRDSEVETGVPYLLAFSQQQHQFIGLS